MSANVIIARIHVSAKVFASDRAFGRLAFTPPKKMTITSLPPLRGRLLSASLLSALLVAVQSVSAATATWSGASASTWNNAGNWDVLPSISGDSLVFAGSANLANSNDFVTGVAGITFASGAGSFTLGGNALTVAGGSAITNNSSSAQTISLALTNSGATTLNAASGNLTLTGLLGGGSLVVEGSGGKTVTLSRSGSNTFGMGATVNNGGTLLLQNSSGSALSNFVTINNGGTVRLGGASTDQIHFNSILELNGASAVFDMNGKNEEVGKLQGSGGTVLNNNASAATFTVGGGTNSSDFSNITLANGTGILAVTTRDTVVANTYTLGSANTFTGKMTIGGTTNVSVLANGGSASSIGQATAANSNLDIKANGTMRYTGANASTDRNFTTSAGAKIEVVNAGTNLTLTGTSFGAFTKTGAGTLTMSGNVSSAAAPSVSGGVLVLNAPGTNAFSGSITVASGGTMRLGSASNGNMIHDNTTLAVNSGGTFDLGGQSEKFKSISGAGAIVNSGFTQSTLTVSGFSGSSVFDGVISGDIALTHTDAASSTTLNGLNTYSGNTSINHATASLILGTAGGLTFYPTDNGVSNQVVGASGATATFNGRFTFDLVGTDNTPGNSWSIVEVSDLNESFSASFFVQDFTEVANVWTLTSGLDIWTFSEATGVLSYASAIPEPSTAVVLAGAGALAAAACRRRRRA